MPSKDMTHHGTNISWKMFSYVIMIFYTLLTIGPLFWMLYSSFKPHNEIIRNAFTLPSKLFVKNYADAYKLGNLGLYFLNSIFYSVVATFVTVVIALMCGFGFAKFEYRKLTALLYLFFTLGLLITVHSVLVPLFVLELKLGIDDSRIGVIIPYIAFGLPMLVYLATTFIKGIPDSLIEAGVIDGAGYLTIFRRLIVPICTPVITTMVIFCFMGNWNEFVLVLTLTSRAAIRSLPVGINSFAGGRSRDYGMQLAALVMGTAPMIIFYIFFQKQIAAGFTAGSVKE